MIVYAERETRIRTADLISAIEAASDPTERLIRLGQLEAGVLDALCPDHDDLTPVNASLPDYINVRVPEGFAFYALYPDQYERAVQTFTAAEQPSRAVVIGIRSIGTALSRVVAKALESREVSVERFTVRPHGHPFDRRLELSPALEAFLRDRRDAHFCIVDEGPGLSGSSFTSVARKLSELGIEDRRINLFPSHTPNVERFVSESARTQWLRHPVYVEPFTTDGKIPPGARDISGGGWRALDNIWPAVNPWHERRKYLHENRIWKFSGLGHLGRERYERGLQLTDAGFIPPVIAFENGFIVSEFKPREAVPESAMLTRAVQYLAHLRREFATDLPVPYAALIEMVRVNTGIELPAYDGLIEDGYVIQGDGRMLPHEWVGLLKSDALDHYDDHFFPGCQDVAWDLAGLCVEWGFPDEAVLAAYTRECPDPTLERRLQFYRTAYLAYRIGYVSMALDSLGESDERPRFAALKERYLAALSATDPRASSRA